MVIALVGASILLAVPTVRAGARRLRQAISMLARHPVLSGHVPKAALGVNLGEVNYYTSQIVFLDLVKQAQDWGLGSEGKIPPTDSHGWPLQIERGRAAGFIARVPAVGGVYVATYRGRGDLRITHGGTIISSRTGHAMLQLDGGPVHVRIVATDPADPLRDLHIVPVGHERDHETVLFDPRFLEAVRPFGVLRFMDWARTNGSNQVRWRERPRPDDFSQGTEKGIALEYAIELCNRVRADCWLNVPHMADDGYVQGMADLVHDRLAPGLRAYIEYSNEIWNFAHGDWCQQQGEKLGMPREWKTRLRYQAHRSLEIFRVFERVMGRDRIVRVLASQAWNDRLRIVAEWEEAFRHADALAVAPYFCGGLTSDDQIDTTRRLRPAEVAERCIHEMEDSRMTVREALAVASRLDLPLIGYEGGQGLVTGGKYHGDAQLQLLLDEANRSPEMGRAYAYYLSTWRDEGGQLLVLYKLASEPGKWGRWGLLENLDGADGSTPKYRAAVDFLRANSPWWKPLAKARP